MNAINFSAIPRSAYLHVPFCIQRCGYCDFSIVAGRDDLIPRYLKAIEAELARGLKKYKKPVELETLFVGGGTPTLLSPSQLETLFSILLRYFRLAKNAEFSIEANPDGLTIEKQQVLKQFGVNRISLGVQSFDADVLKKLDRKHSPQDVIKVFEQLTALIANISLDLIYGAPNQSFQSWQQTVQQAIELRPAHISTYALTYEKGTSFWSKREQGKLTSIEDSLEVQMYLWSCEQLKSQGFCHYEISNFANAGLQSRHNCAYWQGDPYFAFGPGASRFVNGVRSTNHRSPFTWMKRIENKNSPSDFVDNLNSKQRARELFAIGLRYLPGVEKKKIEQLTGHRLENLLEQELRALKQKNWVEETDQHIRLTKQGILFADAIACEVI